MTLMALAPLGASTAAEWLCEWSRRTSENQATADESLVHVAFLAAMLERANELPTLSDEELAPLQAALQALPPQLVHLPPTLAPARWLSLAALAEFRGEPALARVIVSALAALWGEHDHDPYLRSGDTRELLALCWTRRARMSRVAGMLDDAEACAEEAHALAHGLPWRDAMPAASLALANIAIARGNYPACEARLAPFFSGAHTVSPVHRAAAHQMRAIVRRRRGEYMGALEDSWEAYDLHADAGLPRAEIVISMAESALQAGDVDAAFAAFGAAWRELIASGGTLRLRAAAITGRAKALNALTERGLAPGESECDGVRDTLDALLDEPLAPRERTYALYTIAECLLLRGETDAAAAQASRASALASAHAFHDFDFQLEALTQRIARAGRQTPVSRTAWSVGERHPAVTRLASLV